jgi:hypothetical protein
VALHCSLEPVERWEGAGSPWARPLRRRAQIGRASCERAAWKGSQSRADYPSVLELSQGLTARRGATGLLFCFCAHSVIPEHMFRALHCVSSKPSSPSHLSL